MRLGDPEADFARREQEQEEWLKSRPVCTHCRQHIQDEKLASIEGECYHIKCVEEVFVMDTDEFIF